MVKIFNPSYGGGDSLGQSLANLGKSMFGDQTGNLLKTAQLYAAERENAEMDNLMARVAGGGAHNLMADPIAQAMILGSGYKPDQFADLGLMGAANEFGAADPRTQNAQVGTGQSYRNTAGAFNADLAETARNNNMQSADRRYGVDQNVGEQRRQFDMKPIDALDAQGNPVFAPQGQAVGGGFQPILSDAERRGTLAGQNFGNLQDLNPNQQEYLGALPGSAGGSRTPKNYILPNGQTIITNDGITDAQNGRPLPPGGYIGTVQGSASDVLTNAVRTDVQSNEIANEKFNTLANMADALTSDPMLFGVPGLLRSKAQDVLQSAGGVAAVTGAGEQFAATLTDSAGNKLGPDVARALIPELYDPRLGEVEALWGLLLYQGAAALNGQEGRSVSDKDVEQMRRILGDPHSLFSSNLSMKSKLATARKVVAEMSEINKRALGGAAPVTPSPTSQPGGETVIDGIRIRRLN